MRPALPRWLRATLVTTHITTAASWLGTDATLIALTIAGKPIPAVLGAWITTPAAAITLATGITLAAHKPWGLRRHHWIGVKIRIAAIIIAAGLTSLTGALDPMTVLTARICALIALITTIAVSVTKPWGLTPHGRAASPTTNPTPALRRTGRAAA
ncbi:MAG: hypothetical protein ACJ72I_01720 [Pseudonocardiaceae bacterium]